jgi:endonuclease/exonuclease/phosphatase family metal-dependent hydrolase
VPARFRPRGAEQPVDRRPPADAAPRRDREPGHRLTLFDTHFDHQGETAGRESADLLRARVESEDHPVVLVGDLNCTPEGEAYRVLAAEDGPLRDARRVSTHGHHGPDVTFTGYGPLAEGRRLDYAFVTDDVTVHHHGVGTDVDADGRYPSDHLPLFVDVGLR